MNAHARRRSSGGGESHAFSFENNPVHHNDNRGGDRTRDRSVFVRTSDQARAMSRYDRAKNAVTSSLGMGSRTSSTDIPPLGPNANANANPNPNEGRTGSGSHSHSRSKDGTQHRSSTSNLKRQYRMETAKLHPFKRSWWVRLIACIDLCGCCSRLYRSPGLNDNANYVLSMYLHWSFRVNFVFLFCTMCLCFFALVIIFAGFITFAGNIDPECVRIGAMRFGHAGTPFADAFALSWTTFSTVGYGSVYPALGFQNNSPTHCFFVNFICSLEALIGILYAGFCGAILFGKVLRIQSQAQVIFSDPVLIRYGPISLATEISFADDDGMDAAAAANQSPCPVLEFRIVNCLFNEVGGEIMDASINVVGNVDANDADPDMTIMTPNSSSHNSLLSSAVFESSGATTTMSEPESNAGPDSSEGNPSESEYSHGTPLSSSSPAKIRQLSNLLTPVLANLVKDKLHQVHQTVDEDPSSHLVSKHVFSKLQIEAADHPFFKRVWLARHVLDDNSPLLKPRIRKLIRKNDGQWPERLNNYDAIRASLQFNQILVSLNGVSNVSASNVHAQKIYDFVDVKIGYQFVNILYHTGDGQLGVDIDLINDVREQAGGGGEPLMLDA